MDATSLFYGAYLRTNSTSNSSGTCLYSEPDPSLHQGRSGRRQCFHASLCFTPEARSFGHTSLIRNISGSSTPGTYAHPIILHSEILGVRDRTKEVENKGNFEPILGAISTCAQRCMAHHLPDRLYIVITHRTPLHSRQQIVLMNPISHSSWD